MKIIFRVIISFKDKIIKMIILILIISNFLNYLFIFFFILSVKKDLNLIG